MIKVQDLTGKIFGRLTVINFHSLAHPDRFWICKCECGNKIKVLGHSLKKGNTKSCGCLNKEKCKILGYSMRKHGMSFTKEHRAWLGLKRRCYNKKSNDYADYGGKGIKVCDKWLESFENFFIDMGMAPSKKHSIDRFPNMNGNYEKNNCRWATAKEQVLNRTVTVFVNIDGIIMCKTDASRYINISRETYRKYDKLGYTAQQIKLLFDEKAKSLAYIKRYKARFL